MWLKEPQLLPAFQALARLPLLFVVPSQHLVFAISCHFHQPGPRRHYLVLDNDGNFSASRYLDTNIPANIPSQV